ncbi:tetratricopeptide repeat protein [Aureisphaera galaxeae]|uniref:tetratricopeptide repeat protein n=1 Tax=Aureisphaera galaxeae TaxID=1538023 RepID=UPI00234FDECE|nr:tetratricopeptide repeat protein [Aureisphaera galaxeae]MDC8005690.1 tetratricopeptide repeat protein [Aureisphaera galaxeae]
MKTVFYILIALVFSPLHGQNMNEGFSLLEEMKYSEAATYFNNLLEEHPENITAKICKARALGLDGKTQLAKRQFSDLLKKYPENFEIQLNYSESLLWNKDFLEAEKYYLSLYEKHPSHFTVLLGLANSLSNLKNYDDALTYINKALHQKPKNHNAELSRKYMLLGKAEQELKQDNFDLAHALWEKILDDFPMDLDALWSQGHGYLIQQNWIAAERTFGQIEDPVHSQMGLGLVFYKQGIMKKALSHSLHAKNKVNKEDANLYLKATVQYLNALLWNSKFKLARNGIQALENDFPNTIEAHNMWAQYGMYTGNFKLSIAKFRTILESKPNSFDGLLGMANAQRALGNQKKAREFAKRTLHVYPNQKDALRLLDKMDKEARPKTITKALYSWDNGNNIAQTFGATTTWSPSAKWNVFFNYENRNATNQNLGEKATMHKQELGGSYQIRNKTWVKGSLGFINNKGDVTTYNEVVASASFEAEPTPRQYVKIGFQRDLETFNATLLNERIHMAHWFVQHNIVSRNGMGWYTSYRHTNLSDGNVRNLLFSSVYKSLFKKPSIKTGVNYQFMTYNESRTTLYFSPLTYHTTEVFLDGTIKNDKWQGLLTIASGYQWIETDSPTVTLRCQGSITYNLGKEFSFKASGKYSSIAASNAGGFNYKELGLHLIWVPYPKTSKQIKVD